MWDERDEIENELERELAPGHALESQPYVILARAVARDRILLRLLRPPHELYVVHVTHRVERDPSRPLAVRFDTVESFATAYGD